MAKVINADKLTQSAKKYDKVLRTLPFFSLETAATALRMNVLEVDDEDVIVNKRRKAGGTGPYKQGMTIGYQDEIMKFYESNLKPELVVFKVKDNITNYKEKKLLVEVGKKLDLKKKNHPLEFEIVKDIVTSHGEDVVFSLFHAERDEDRFSPITAFTGFFPALDMLTTEGYISTAEKNTVNTGAIVAPTSATDVEAYEKLVQFLASGHPMLRSANGGIPQLLISEDTLVNVRSAFRNKVKNIEYATMDRMIEALREDARIPQLVVDIHQSLGTGSKLILQKVGNMDIGFNTGKAQQFVQVRNIFEDPNEVQFWLEAGYGVRIRDVHKKVFLTNEQSNTAIDLAGDYK